MTVLWLTLASVFLLALMARYFSVPSIEIENSVKPNKLLAVLAAFCLIMIAGLQKNVGDTPFYMRSYETTNFMLEIYENGQKDLGFNVLQLLLQTISKDPQILVFVVAFITNTLIVIGFYKYSRLFELSLYAFITSGAFVVSMNGLRQYLVAAVLFIATKYILEGSWKKYIAVVLIASLFHQSALIMIPIYFIVRRKAWTGSTYFLLLIAVLIVFGFNQFSTVLFSALKDTQYGEYQNFQEGGANIIRVIVFASPLVLSYFGRDKLRELYPKIDIFVNLSLLGVVIMIISTQNWIFARMAIYFNQYLFVLLAWNIKAFRQNDQKLIYLIILVLYACFFFYESVIALGFWYESDYIKIS
ncbi:EpsG family protein [Paenibacillus harenae]|uniref:Transmembrane protein EpsG n=1 Tax=Paenibacillus harenae TaxID=306543 RepID=A0ABT9U739_PAEHA|nr:EpsG family protein [Paenibacillus harenae]MDQ0114833.1 transmembrane protein EpsG [Paenibacillus harenae]